MSTTTRGAFGPMLAALGGLALVLAACGPMAQPEVAAPGPGEAGRGTGEAVPSPTPSGTATRVVRPSGPATDRDWDLHDGPTSTPTPTTESPAASEPTPASEPTTPASSRVLERGDRGPAVAAVQQRLVELGYWLGTADGVYGALTEQAVLALQGWEGIARDGRVGPRTRRTLADAGRPVPDHEGGLVEIHRSQGVLLVVRGGTTRWAIHTSPGTGEHYTQPDGGRALADTPAGTWTIGWQVNGWRESFLGRLWRPKYFHASGLAIHGYPEVPAWPASHGCARVSMEAMNLLWEQGLAPLGTTVVVS